VKYLVSYLYDYAHKQCDELEYRITTDEFGNKKPVIISNSILFKLAAERIELLEERIKELERIERIIKIAEEVVI
jgi:hypothetical protein